MKEKNKTIEIAIENLDKVNNLSELEQIIKEELTIKLLNAIQEELNRRKIQISNNIERLKTDKEYILSYAKTFGYLDDTKNEKIIKIIKNEDETKNTEEVLASSDIKENDNYINIRGALILASMIALCFITYLLLINKNLLPKLKKKKIITSRG